MLRTTLRTALSPWQWPLSTWLLLLGMVLAVRFPLKFLVDQAFLMDFDLFHTIAQRVLSHQAITLYDQADTPQAVFKYAPLWALAWTPLGWLSSHAGAVAWSTLTAGFLLGTCWTADRLCRTLGLSPAGFVAPLAVLLLVRPLTAEFLNGQVNVLWGLLVLVCLLAEAARRPWLAALSLASAISLKLPALLFLLYLAARRRWASAGRTLLLLVALNLVAAWALVPSRPLALLAAWQRTLLATGPDRAFEIGSQSLLALLGRLLRADGYGFNVLALPDGAVAAVAALVSLALFAAVCLPPARGTPDPLRTLLDGALLNVFMVLFSPTCWVATYSALLFPVFVAIALFSSQPRAVWRRPSLTLGALAGLLFSALTHAKVWRFLGVRAIKGETYVFEVLMILPLFGLSLAWCLWHQRRWLARRS
ncbi:MAG: DUF2029 domain-containing protein [Candidatus Omnitrophica bacterium]|nr:DUF2029 domain-containing protein [Candidatus Omnitrophota bacterium]